MLRHGMDRLIFMSRRMYSMLMTAPLPCLEFKRELRPTTCVTALSIINEHFGKECSNPRDHIYGLAALCNLGASYQISYSTLSLTVQEVFIDFTLHCVRTTRTLEAFQYINRSTVIRGTSTMDLMDVLKHRAWTPGLPSWCPDFAGPKPMMRTFRESRGGRFALTASKSRPAQLTASSRQRLGAIGVQIGTVQNFSIGWYGVRDHHTYSETSISIWQHMVSFQKCMSTCESSTSAQLICKLLLDALSLGEDWRQCTAWFRVADTFPGKTKARMIRSSLGAAWIIHHLPDLASKAKLTLQRWHSPRAWREIASDVNSWLYDGNMGTRLFKTDNADALIGTGPEGLRAGDIVSVLFGGEVPFILRPATEG